MYYVYLQLKEICDCQLVDFPFSKFPEHVALLKAYCWKPLIIQVRLPLAR